MSKPKVIQMSTATIGDNQTCAMTLVTTILRDDGRIFEGSMQTTGGNYNDGYTYEMVWDEVVLPECGQQ